MMVDAGVVIAEILLDLHAMRSKFEFSFSLEEICLNVSLKSAAGVRRATRL
jgi:hypothetical protein